MAFWLSVQRGEKRGLRFSLLRAFLSFAAAAYSTGLWLYLAAERVGLRRRAGLPVPVISIGNITSGGTGKTPVTQLIARTLRDQHLSPVILSRGHGGRLSATTAQVSDSSGNILLTARDAGDEAAALARLTPGVPVFIGKKRVLSGKMALENCRPGVFLLDDGFQYWQLRRDLDIVLIDSRAPFDNGSPLPRGTLREPKRNLRRAGIVVITRSDLAAERQLEALQDEIARLAPAAAVFRARHVVSHLTPLNRRAETAHAPSRPLTACGVAQPDAFLVSLQASGISASAECFVALQDHARFGSDELSIVDAAISDTGADSLIVTNKDAVKFDAEFFQVPVYAAELEVKVENASEFWAVLSARAGLRADEPLAVN